MGKKGSIKLIGIAPLPDDYTIESLVIDGPIFLVTIEYKVRSGYKLKSNSIRIYYSDSPQIVPGGGTPYVTIDPDAKGMIDDPRVLMAIPSPENTGYIRMYCFVPGATGAALETETTYWLRAWMQVYKSNGKAYKKYRGPKYPTPATTSYDPSTRKLFQVAAYSNPHPGEDNRTEYNQVWDDFTDCIIMSSYDVNYVDTNEDWIDANYDTHRIVPKTKIKGSFDMMFSTRERYNRFIKLIKQNRLVNGLGYTQLQVHVNNELAIDEEDIFKSDIINDLPNAYCRQYIGMFFLKMESNPWNVPVFGHYDQYDAIHITIEEAYNEDGSKDD